MATDKSGGKLIKYTPVIMDFMQNKIITGLLMKCFIAEYKSVMEEINIDRIKR